MKLIHGHFFSFFDKTPYNIIISILSLIIICVIGPLSINLGLIDFSFQTLCIMLMALFLRPLPSFLLIIVYLALGAVGLPVYSGYSSGFQHLMSASAGFLYSFPFFAMFFSVMVSKYGNRPIIIFISSIAAQLGLLMIGFGWIIIGNDMEWIQVRENVYSLLPGLILKAALIALINYLFLNYIFRANSFH